MSAGSAITHVQHTWHVVIGFQIVQRFRSHGAVTGGLYVLDIWRCDNFNPSSMSGLVWTQMNMDAVAAPTVVEGNQDAYNQWVLGFGIVGTMGFQYYGPSNLIW